MGPEIANLLSPISQVIYSDYKKKHTIAGVSSLDYLQLYRQFTFTQQSSYRLDYIGQQEVGMKKVEYDGTLDDLYETDLQTFIDYNIRDVKILVELEKKLKLIEIYPGTLKNVKIVAQKNAKKRIQTYEKYVSSWSAAQACRKGEAGQSQAD